MTDNQTPEKDFNRKKNNQKEFAQKEFVQEEIVKKPVNRRRLTEKLLISAACGVVFALAASLMFFVISQISRSFGQESASLASESEAEELPGATEADTEPETEESTEKDIVIVQQDVNLTIEDYQKLNNELYAIGSQGNRSVVAITSISENADMFHNAYQTEAEGAGVIVAKTDSEYLILTEKNAIPDAGTMTVTFYNDVSASAYLKSSDKNTGIAIIAVKTEDLDPAAVNQVTVAEIADSSTVRRGQIAIAIGSPLGQCYSILIGNITSVDHKISLQDNNFSMLTTDITGNSLGSGVLIDTSGCVIGLIMQEYNDSGNQGTLTAVAISEVKQLITLLMNGEEIPYLGISVSDVTNKIASAYDIPKGVYIREVTMDSPAMLGGLQSGDVITAIGGIEVTNAADLFQMLLQRKPGTGCSITVQRQNGDSYNKVACNVTLDVMQ